MAGHDQEVVVPQPGCRGCDEVGKVVTGADGRIATANAEPGTHEIEVTFGDKPAAAPAALPHPAPTPPAAASKDKRTWPKRAPH